MMCSSWLLSLMTCPIKHGTIVEAALSPFLFSHGVKVCTTGMTLCRYPNPYTQMHFSPFTMPYLNLMIQIRQAHTSLMQPGIVLRRRLSTIGWLTLAVITAMPMTWLLIASLKQCLALLEGTRRGLKT